jgi:L-ribulose-5-phosphate 3-epimerase
MTRRDVIKLSAGAAAFPTSAPSQTQLKPDVGNISRLKTAICAYSFRDQLKDRTMSYSDLIRYAVATGADGLDMTVYWLPSDPTEMLPLLRGLAYRHGVAIYSLSIRTVMTRPRAEQRRAEVNEIQRWLNIAERLGAGHIRVFGGKVPEGVETKQANDWVVEVLKEAAALAGSKGIVLGLENHDGLADRGEDIVAILKAVNSPWVGINLDTGNFTTDAMTQIEICAPYAVNVQLKTEIADASGNKTTADWDRIVKVLARSGYKGYLAIEYEAKGDPAAEVARQLKKLRQIAYKHSTI